MLDLLSKELYQMHTRNKDDLNEELKRLLKKKKQKNRQKKKEKKGGNGKRYMDIKNARTHTKKENTVVSCC